MSGVLKVIQTESHLSGGKIYGDLHISDVFVGRHKDYLVFCFKQLAKIRDEIISTKPAFVVFTGDLIGWTERNVKNRQVLKFICEFFKDISSVSTVFCVRGNHDVGDYPDFQFLAELGYFHTFSSLEGGCFDFTSNHSSTEQSVRFHIVDYGHERRELSLDSDKYNVVLAHNNFTIQGETNWYQEHDGIELNTLTNFNGVYMVVAGHIHNPSPEIVSTQMRDGSMCSLFYVGNPTCTIYADNMWKSCWVMDFSYTDGDLNYNAIPLPCIDSLDEIFYRDDEIITDESAEAFNENIRLEQLNEVLEEIMKYNLAKGDIVSQVERIPTASDEAKSIAVSYIRVALSSIATA